VSIFSDARVTSRLLFAPIRGATHRDRLESFYRHQAQDYDRFRKKLLHGRQALYESLPTPLGGTWIEMGGGTGANLEFLADRIGGLESVHVVDLSSSLLAQATERIARHKWKNVKITHGDVLDVDLPAADIITFSYSLTMIPPWYAAIDRALELLKPGGILAVVDFYVSRKYPSAGRGKHGWFPRSLWPLWFAMDNVHLSADHLPYLESRLQAMRIDEGWGAIPWVPWLRVPYYTFVGQKPRLRQPPASAAESLTPQQAAA